jgi:thiamine-monophosphate kinase
MKINMNEFDYIDKYFRPLTNKFALNLKNDAAIFNQKSSFDLIISTDTLVEGIHFFGNEDPADIAKKSLRVNLSDMAAMGAKPIFYNLSLSVPKVKASQFIPKFVKGLQDDQEIFDIKLIGGDLTSSLKHINITITIFGKSSKGKSIPRDGAKIGDCLYVSGILGLSKIGLDNYNSNFKELQEAKRKYLLPQPRVDLGISLKNIANSMIDISDGLVQDATHLAKNSELTVELNLSKIPIPNINKIDKKIILDSALYGGDDYELLFSCDPFYENSLAKLSSKMNLKLTKIGYFKKFNKEFLKFKNNNSKPKNSYLHF